MLIASTLIVLAACVVPPAIVSTGAAPTQLIDASATAATANTDRRLATSAVRGLAQRQRGRHDALESMPLQKDLNALGNTRARSAAATEHGYFLPTFGLALCICPKCGSTTMLNYIFKLLRHRPWPYGAHKPWVQHVMHPVWKHNIVPLDEVRNHSLIRHRLALVREPRSRLLSAFNDKYACADPASPARRHRSSNYTSDLQRIAERASTVNRSKRLLLPCMSLRQFERALSTISKGGLAHETDVHIRRQSDMCFKRRPPEWWDVIASFANHTAAQYLATVLRDRSAASRVKSIHCAKPGASRNGTCYSEQPVVSKLPKQWSSTLEEWASPDVNLLRHFVNHPHGMLQLRPEQAGGPRKTRHRARSVNRDGRNSKEGNRKPYM
jgi:hypothetical protein